MNVTPSTLLFTDNGPVCLKDIAVLDHNDVHNEGIVLTDKNTISYLQGDKSTRVMAIVIGDLRLMAGENTKVLMDDGEYKYVHRLLIGDKIRHRLPEPLEVTEIRRVIGSILTYVLYSPEGYVELSSGVRVDAIDPSDLIDGGDGIEEQGDAKPIDPNASDSEPTVKRDVNTFREGDVSGNT